MRIGHVPATILVYGFFFPFWLTEIHLGFYRLEASSVNVNLSIVPEESINAVYSEPSSTGLPFAQKLSNEFSISLATDKPMDMSKPKTSGVNGSYNVLKLSEASVESAGAKAAACRTLSVLASLSDKGIKVFFLYLFVHVLANGVLKGESRVVLRLIHK
ncbi:hypothetical protein GUJ93_ZPchr0009g522 [Zizania palustris]|uniref:Uncharacterized protein n=1 Tax=Zizania palustris TaxID=103762 RepID=A0A8J5S1T2_ZIZPA|nr:hypothetical protein GUJ93_ZPchr0009g522 [Zizania palustris]